MRSHTSPSETKPGLVRKSYIQLLAIYPFLHAGSRGDNARCPAEWSSFEGRISISIRIRQPQSPKSAPKPGPELSTQIWRGQYPPGVA